MDSEKAQAAIDAIRQMLDLDKHPYGYLPNPAARLDAGNQIRIIRENSPKSCHWKLNTLARWLDDIFVQENDEGKRLPPVKQIQGYALGVLARIEGEVKKVTG